VSGRGPAVPISPFSCRMVIKQMAVIHEPPPNTHICALPLGRASIAMPRGGRGGGVPDPPPKPEESTEVRCTPSANMRESERIKSRYQQNEMKWFKNINCFAKICQDYLKLFYVYGRKKMKINLSLKISPCSFYINWEI
jgi:hypothetical protein